VKSKVTLLDFLAFLEMNLRNLAVNARLDDHSRDRLDGSDGSDQERRRRLGGNIRHDGLRRGWAGSRPGLRCRLKKVPAEVIGAGEENHEQRSENKAFHSTFPQKALPTPLTASFDP
jgi:hypothetical protein